MRRAGWTALLALAVAGAPLAGAASRPTPAELRAADALVARPPSRERDRALTRWAGGADLTSLMFVLRHPPRVLGASEVPLLEEALARAPKQRAALRQRLAVRLAALVPARAARLDRELRHAHGAWPARPRAGVFRIASLLPARGSYDDFALAVRQGLAAALAQHRAEGGPPLELIVAGTGAGEPAEVAARLDSVADVAGAIVGELLSTPTLVAAAAARMVGVPLLSPTAIDESIGAVGPHVFQIGPSGAARGAALAARVLARPRRVEILTAVDLDHGPFASGFAAVAESLASAPPWRSTFVPGTPDFRAELRAMRARGVEVVFFDGDVRDAATFARQVAQEKLRVTLVGGRELDPDRHHATVRPALEGAQFVDEDWRLDTRAMAALDSLVRAAGAERATNLHVRGYLAGRAITAAVAAGALCPEELADALAARLAPAPRGAGRGFLDVRADRAHLPVFVVERGRAVER
jgi:ABC-type branched-subunit amino acid transport system substrate-binding protein